MGPCGLGQRNCKAMSYSQGGRAKPGQNQVVLGLLVLAMHAWLLPLGVFPQKCLTVECSFGQENERTYLFLATYYLCSPF